MEKHSFSRRVNPTIGAQETFSKIFPSLILLFFNDLFRPIRIIFLLFSGKKEDVSVNRKWKGSLNIFLVCVKMFLNI